MVDPAEGQDAVKNDNEKIIAVIKYIICSTCNYTVSEKLSVLSKRLMNIIYPTVTSEALLISQLNVIKGMLLSFSSFSFAKINEWVCGLYSLVLLYDSQVLLQLTFLL